jgi:hypothetical protein
MEIEPAEPVAAYAMKTPGDNGPDNVGDIGAAKAACADR